MAISTGEEDKQGFSEINVTPLTDVLLVLLIIFLITGSSITAPSHDIVLPDVITKEKAEDVNIVIDISKEGVTYVGNLEMTKDKLRPYLETLAKEKQTDRVIINADNKTPYTYIVIAMDAARKGGLINIALATDYDEAAAEKAGAVKPEVKVEE